jgi:ketosteroid isomerase-like protein
MTHRTMALMILLLIGLAGTAVASSDETAVSTPHTRALEQFNALYSQAMASGRPDAVLALAHERIRVAPEYNPTLMGREQVAAYYTVFARRFEVKEWVRRPIRAYDLGPRIAAIGGFRVVLALRDGGQRHALDGKYLDIWDKGDGDSLTLATQTWNFDSYPAIAISDALRFPEVPSVRTAFEPRVPVKDPLSFELSALNALTEDAITQHDAGVWSQFYADDAAMLPNHHAAVTGRAAIDAYLVEHAAHLPVFEKLDIRHDRIDAMGRYVIDYASHVATWRNGHSSGVNTGKNIRIWRREPGGGLRMICQIGTYD